MDGYSDTDFREKFFNVNLLIPFLVFVSTFPSGQTATSFAAATIIGLKYHSKHRVYWFIYPNIIRIFNGIFSDLCRRTLSSRCFFGAIMGNYKCINYFEISIENIK